MDRKRINRQLMREEDARSRAVEMALKQAEAASERAKQVLVDNRNEYPVRRVVGLPYVRVTGALLKSKQATAALPRFLDIDTDVFHAFALGKQILPASREAVMQALCPTGLTPAFDKSLDIHLWGNATVLFIPALEGMYLDFLLQEATVDEEDFAFFRWVRTGAVTPEILSRLTQIEKGDERLRIDDNYYDAPTPIGTPRPLLLFIQFPQVRAGQWKPVALWVECIHQLQSATTLGTSMMDEAAETVSEYEAKRQRRVEENQRMLQSLKLPIMSRPSPRPQPVKATVKLEPTRRSSRQEKRRTIAEQQEQKRLLIKVKEREEKEKQKKLGELKRGHNLVLKEQKLQKKQKMQMQELEAKGKEETRLQQLKLRELKEIRRRNAEIQRFIQEELNKQAVLAMKTQQLERERQIGAVQREAERVKHAEQQCQNPITVPGVDGKHTVQHQQQ
ncbi:unnamed protein product [Phytophthora fragariaefolia]|uniref:Unnamed protein product n=1 Tax=Phytophthora fragariaefolia TaxID=1490495 RepID=A0A9W7CQY3_9STRA|nr:unnamed protein product [Phytophthora fragariaefolia]